MKKKKITPFRKETAIGGQEDLATTMIKQARERCRFVNKLIKMKAKEKDL